MIWTVPSPSSRVFHCTRNSGICHTGLLTACEQDQDGTILILLTSCPCFNHDDSKMTERTFLIKKIILWSRFGFYTVC